MNTTSQTYVMIPLVGESENTPSTFIPSFMPPFFSSGWRSMLAGSSAPPMESPPSSGISEVSSDEDMPPVKRIQEISMHEADDEPAPVINMARRDACVHNSSSSSAPAKRVAAPTIHHERVENLRDQAKFSKERARKATTEKKQISAVKERLERENAELQDNLIQLINIHATESKALEARYSAWFVEREGEHKQLVELLSQSRQQMHTLQHQLETMQQAIAERDKVIVSSQTLIESIQEKSQQQAGLLAERENDIFTLRTQMQRLTAATNNSTSNAPGTSPGRQSTPSRRFRRAQVAPNPGVNLGTVPLAPSQPSLSPRREEARTSAEPQGPPVTIDVSIVKTIVQETIWEMNGGTTASPKNASGGRKRAGRPAVSPMKHQQSKMSKEDDLEWKESIRSFWRQTYERATAELFEDYIPAQVACVNAVRDGGDLPSDVLDLDFSPGYEKSRWNRLVLGRLYQQLIQSRADEGGWGLVDVSEEYVMGLLAGQLKRSRDAWAVHQPKFSQTTGRFENSAEATRRAEESRESVHSGKVLRSRRKAKFERRTDTVKQVLALKTHSNAPDLEAWRRFKKMLDFLDVDGMSDEENETRYLEGQAVDVFIVKRCPWRAAEITEYLKFIDQEAANPVLQSSRGSSLAPRLRSDAPGGPVKPGLPRTMYDPVWLAEMAEGWEDFESDNIRPSEEIFELLTLATHT